MKELHGMAVWAPTDAEIREIERRVRAERAGAVRGAATYVARKVGDAFIGERAADKIHLDDAKTS